MNNENETVVFVEFDDNGRPYMVVTLEQGKSRPTFNDYDFAWSKKYGMLYSAAGSMGVHPLKLGQSARENPDGTYSPIETVYWSTSEVEVEEPPLAKRLDALPDEWTPEKLFDSLHAIECDTIIWCSDCDDCYPDNPADYCKHVWWCGICEASIMPDDEPCKHYAEVSDE